VSEVSSDAHAKEVGLTAALAIVGVSLLLCGLLVLSAARIVAVVLPSQVLTAGHGKLDRCRRLHLQHGGK
jgi:hypothetical protein